MKHRQATDGKEKKLNGFAVIALTDRSLKQVETTGTVQISWKFSREHSAAMKVPIYTLFVVFLGLFAVLWWGLVHHSQLHTSFIPNSRIAERVKSYFYRNSSDVTSVTTENSPLVEHERPASKDSRSSSSSSSKSTTSGSSGSSGQDMQTSKTKLEMILADRSLSTGAHSLAHSLI